ARRRIRGLRFRQARNSTLPRYSNDPILPQGRDLLGGESEHFAVNAVVVLAHHRRAATRQTAHLDRHPVELRGEAFDWPGADFAVRQWHQVVARLELRITLAAVVGLLHR